MHRPVFVLVGAFLGQMLCALPAHADAGTPDVSRLKAHTAFLADDLLDGREIGTRGYDLAALRVAGQLLQLGLKPTGDSGICLQTVPLRGGAVVPGAAVFEIQRSTVTHPLASLSEFLIGPRRYADQADVTAPRFQHDGYEGTDVRR
jgi:hypothetical protein